MTTRRQFLKLSLAYGVLYSFPIVPFATCATIKVINPMKKNKPQKAVVLWYSQTNHTQRIGKLISSTWQKNDIQTTAMDIRSFDLTTISSYDLIALGSPVHYCDVPDNVKDWINRIPDIKGIPIASFVTYGGPGDAEYHTGFSILDMLAEKGGIPIGMNKFGNMSTFAPTWSIGNEKRILKYKHLPNEETYQNARNFAQYLVENVKNNLQFDLKKTFYLDNYYRYLPQRWFSKLLINRHTISKEKCIGCLTCVEKCPVNAIDPDNARVDTKKCIACMGCVNNCPAQAIDMEFMGKKVIGFFEFLKQNQITIKESDELL